MRGRANSLMTLPGIATLCMALSLLPGCTPPQPGSSDVQATGSNTPEQSAAGSPRPRVVSLDYCADQFVLGLVPREQIQALSTQSTMAHAYLRKQAVGIAQVKPRAEDLLTLGPDLVVRSYGGGPRIADLLGSAGIPVVQIGYSNRLEDIFQIITETALALDQVERGTALIATMEARLAAIPQPHATSPRALYLTSTGFTAGPGTLMDDMLAAAGYRNYFDRPGWHPVPLEQLVFSQPDVVAAAFFDRRTDHVDAWSAARHPVVRELIHRDSTVTLEGAWTACGGWFLLDAIEALAAAHSV